MYLCNYRHYNAANYYKNKVDYIIKKIKEWKESKIF